MAHPTSAFGSIRTLAFASRCASLVGTALVVMVVVTLVLTPTAAQAQLPEEFTNLQVLPGDIQQRQLVGIMRGFAFATGLRCSNCHMGEEGQPFSTYDFSSDDRVLKRKARAMLRMTQAINNEHLAGLENRSDLSVTCATCHGGVRRPIPIEQIVKGELEDGSPEDAVAEYRRLRERHFGTRAYDFGQRPLIEVGRELGAQSPEAALALLELNAEFYPESDETYTLIGEVHRGTGDTERALEAYRRALQLNPENRFAQQRITELTGGGS